MNECKIVQDLLPLYVEDLVSPETKVFVDQHCEGCESCGKLMQRGLAEIPEPEKDPKEYKKALRKNQVNLICKAVTLLLVVVVLLYTGCTKLDEYMKWKNGYAPVEQVVKAPVGNGKVTLVDWDESGWEIGGVENVGTILWMETMDVLDLGPANTRYSLNSSGDTRPWENVQIYWAPNGIPFLATAELLEGGKGIFVHDHKSWYDEDGGHHSASGFLPSSRGNGLVDVLTALCRENKDFPTGWESVEFTFHKWQDDSETIIFVYETDNGCRGLLDFHYPSEMITDVN